MHADVLFKVGLLDYYYWCKKSWASIWFGNWGFRGSWFENWGCRGPKTLTDEAHKTRSIEGVILGIFLIICKSFYF